MLEEILKAIPVLLISTVKFFLGPLAGYNLNLPPITTAVATLLGMMISVVAFTYFGEWLKTTFFKRFFNKPTNPNAKEGRFRVMVKQYGLGGIAFFTPLLFTPIVGTLLAIGMGKPRRQIILFMFLSGVFWDIVFTFLIYSYSSVVIDFIKNLSPF
jgi:membrane protein DedA with SNARE-associated domain